MRILDKHKMKYEHVKHDTGLWDESDESRWCNKIGILMATVMK